MIVLNRLCVAGCLINNIFYFFKEIPVMKQIAILLILFSANLLATPVNINTADAETIAQSLPGIGQKKAEDIVMYREENGLFKTVNDLTQVKGIGEKTVEKNLADILLVDKMTKKSKKTKKTKKPQ